MNLEEKIRHHCHLVVEYKDVDAIFSQKNGELVVNYFFELLNSRQSLVDFQLFFQVVQTILENSSQPFELSKQQLSLIQQPKNNEEFTSFFHLILQLFPRSNSLINCIFFWFKHSPHLYSNDESKRMFFSYFEQCLGGKDKLLALESCLILLKYFENDSETTEELNLSVIAILVAFGANEFVRDYHHKTIHFQTDESQKFRNYNFLLSYFNEKNSDAVTKSWNDISFESYPQELQKNIRRLYALTLARQKKNNEAKEMLEQLANEYIYEKNTKEYLKIHCDIVSIIPNDNVEKFATYLDTIEQLFEQSLSKEYLLTLYAKKHEYAKLQNKYEATALAKSFLLASTMQSYDFLEEVSLQLSELSKKRKKTDQALEFLTISTNAKTAVFENRLAIEQRKNTAERLVIEYFGAI
jgi:hypothetical protein